MREFRLQHDWETERSAALARDGWRCTSCARRLLRSTEEWWRLPAAPVRPGTEASGEEWREWERTFLTFQKKVVALALPEVNHIVPVVGAGYGFGCSHHQENLEVLCKACHQKVTAQQRRDRKMQEAQSVYEKEMAARGRRSSSGTRQGDGVETGQAVGEPVVGRP